MAHFGRPTLRQIVQCFLVETRDGDPLWNHLIGVNGDVWDQETPEQAAWRVLKVWIGDDGWGPGDRFEDSYPLLRRGKAMGGPCVSSDPELHQHTYDIHPFLFAVSGWYTSATVWPGLPNKQANLPSEQPSYGLWDIPAPDSSSDRRAQSFQFFCGNPADCRKKDAKSLARVWFEHPDELGPEAGKILHDGLKTLQTDYQSGARRLAARAVEVFQAVILQLAQRCDLEVPGDRDRLWHATGMTVWHLANNGRPSMAASITATLTAKMMEMQAVMMEPDPPPKIEVVGHPRVEPQPPLKVVDRPRVDVEKVVAWASKDEAPPAHGTKEALEKYLVGFIDGKAVQAITILTLSASGTTEEALIHTMSSLVIGPVTVHIRVLESRPLYEGVGCANRLAQAIAARGSHNGSTVTVFTDASAALAAKDADLVLLGADRILGDGAVSNKTGSLPLVLAARYAKPRAKIVVLSDAVKVAPPGPAEDHSVEHSPPDHISSAWTLPSLDAAVTEFPRTVASMPEIAKAECVAFEWVPAELIDTYITDEGIWSGAGKIKEISQRLERQLHQALGGL